MISLLSQIQYMYKPVPSDTFLPTYNITKLHTRNTNTSCHLDDGQTF